MDQDYFDDGQLFGSDSTNFSDMDVASDNIPDYEKEVLLNDREMFKAASAEDKGWVLTYREENMSRNYIKMCEDLYYWRQSVVDNQPSAGAKSFYDEVEQHWGKKRQAVDQYLQFYRNVYQRAWQDIPDKREVVRTIKDCLCNLTDYDCRRLIAQNNSRPYWKFEDANIILMDCVGAGKSINEFDYEGLKEALKPSQNDAVISPEDSEESELDFIFWVASSESREACFKSVTEQGVQRTTHFKMLNCNIVENKQADSVPVVINGTLLACYVRYDVVNNEERVEETNREAFIFDFRHRDWKNIVLEECSLS
jgi:hypothetical protein